MGVHESRIRQALTDLDVDQAAFAALSGVSQSRLSSAFRGVRCFSGPEIEKLSALVTELREIADNAAPIPVAFQNIEATKRLLSLRRGGIVWAAEVHDEKINEDAEHIEQ